MSSSRPSFAASIVLIGIDMYRNVCGNMMLHSCRFSPSCSGYAAEAVRRYGAIKGLELAVRRLLRCRPFSRGGVDPVQ